MSDVVKTYVACFRAKLDTALAYDDLVARCRRRRNPQFLTVALAIGETDHTCSCCAHDTFFSFLTGDGDAPGIVRRLHGQSLSAFDSFDIPLASELKAAGRTMLESEYAIWYAHKQLLDAAVQDSAVLAELDTNEDLGRLVSSPEGFKLHETLSFSEIWKTLPPTN
jgi:hypothetical protein